MSDKKLANFFKPAYRKILLVALVAAFFSYINVVRGPFVWDDEVLKLARPTDLLL